MKVILGPVPCQGCRELVVLGGPRGLPGKFFWRWYDRDGSLHLCEAR